MKESIERALEALDPNEPIDLVKKLVNIPSPEGEELECARFLQAYMQDAGIETHLQEVEEGRANVISVVRGEGDGPTLMFNGHLDTSYTGDFWTDYPGLGILGPNHRPHAYEIGDGIYGLGAQNMKGGIAAAFVTLRALKRAGVKLRGHVMASGVAGESEKAPVRGAMRDYQGRHYRGSGHGAKYLISHWEPMDYVIVGEPSGLYVVNGQAGYLFVKVVIWGKSAYLTTKGHRGSGISAIEEAAEVVRALSQWGPHYTERHTFDTGMGVIEPAVTIGSIDSGWPYAPSQDRADRVRSCNNTCRIKKLVMARPLRLEFPGAVYHVTSRGNARQKVFFADADRALFLNTLAAAVRRYGWICHAYCLMANHYHLLIETPKANLSIGMRQLNGIYTQSFNRRHHRVGHLFQGRFKAILVEKESHLLELCRYIVLNPVRVKGSLTAQSWKWSSYRPTAGLASVPEFLSTDWILEQFGKKRMQAQSRYREFVRDGLASRPWDDLKGQIYLGSKAFIESHAPRQKVHKEIPRAQLQAAKPSLEQIFGRRGETAIAEAYEQGYRLNEIAAHLGVHYATVSRRLQRMEQAN